jgi:hypothetical protein
LRAVSAAAAARIALVLRFVRRVARLENDRRRLRLQVFDVADGVVGAFDPAGEIVGETTTVGLIPSVLAEVDEALLVLEVATAWMTEVLVAFEVELPEVCATELEEACITELGEACTIEVEEACTEEDEATSVVEACTTVSTVVLETPEDD